MFDTVPERQRTDAIPVSHVADDRIELAAAVTFDDEADPFAECCPDSVSPDSVSPDSIAFAGDFVADTTGDSDPFGTASNWTDASAIFEAPAPQSTQAPTEITVHVDNSALISEMTQLVSRVEQLAADERQRQLVAEAERRRTAPRDYQFLSGRSQQQAERDADRERNEQSELAQRQDKQIQKIAGDLTELTRSVDSIRGETRTAISDLTARVAENNTRQLRLSSLLEQLMRQHSGEQALYWNSGRTPQWVMHTTSGTVGGDLYSSDSYSVSCCGGCSHTLYSSAQQWQALPGRIRIQDLTPVVWETQVQRTVAQTRALQESAPRVETPPAVPAVAQVDWVLELPEPEPAPARPVVVAKPALVAKPVVVAEPALVAEEVAAPAAPVETVSFFHAPADDFVLEDVNWPETPMKSIVEPEIQPVVFEHTYEFHDDTVVVPQPPQLVQRPCCPTSSRSQCQSGHCESCRRNSRVTQAAYHPEPQHSASQHSGLDQNHQNAHVRRSDRDALNPLERGIRSVQQSAWVPKVELPQWADRIPESRPVQSVRESRFLNRVSSVFRQAASSQTVE